MYKTLANFERKKFLTLEVSGLLLLGSIKDMFGVKGEHF